MSSVSFVSTTQPSVSVTNVKPTAQQTFATAQPQPTANTSSTTISSTGTAYSYYEQQMARNQAAKNSQLADALANPTSPELAQKAYDMANFAVNGVGEAISGLVNPHFADGPNAIVTYASTGAPVTVASQAYYTQQATIYHNQALHLYNTELAKGTPPGQMVSDLYDLQAKQPDAFRAMNMWTPAADPSTIQAATNTPDVTPQYLNAAGQVVKS